MTPRVAVAALVGTLAVAAPAASETASEPPPKGWARATFAGGCFWSLEAAFDKVKGVAATTTGYAGGSEANPTYAQVAAGGTGHAESVQVAFDPAKVSYDKLLEVFWHNIDPFDAEGQFCDRGRQYRTAIFYEGDEQRRAAEATKDALEGSSLRPAPIATQVLPLRAFYRAEPEQQDFYERNVRRYWQYRTACGRDERLKLIWGSPK
jgi:peptide-methionine (S)-S-oxide reductase